MGYSRETYDKAFKIIGDTKKKREREYELALEEIRATDNAFKEIEAELSRLGGELALTALSGDTEKLGKIQKRCESLSLSKNDILNRAGINKPELYCKKCGDVGYKDGKVCDCVTDIAKKLAFEELSRSLPLGQCRFDNFKLEYYSDAPDSDGSVPRKRAEAVLKLCRQFVEDFPRCRNLLFIGGAGLGKTHLSLALVSEISALGYGVVYGSAQNLFSAAEKEHFSFSGSSAAQDSLLDCDLLVIDDLGTEFYSSFAASLFYNIINSRILSGKPTVINTNLSFDELEKRYSARITSRFIGSYDMKKFIGSDIRQIKALENK